MRIVDTITLPHDWATRKEKHLEELRRHREALSDNHRDVEDILYRLERVGELDPSGPARRGAAARAAIPEPTVVFPAPKGLDIGFGARLAVTGTGGIVRRAERGPDRYWCITIDQARKLAAMYPEGYETQERRMLLMDAIAFLERDVNKQAPPTKTGGQ